jgi:hypothetical protein
VAGECARALLCCSARCTTVRLPPVVWALVLGFVQPRRAGFMTYQATFVF